MAKAVVFPGQGSQFVGMGKDFYDNFESTKMFFEKADEALGYSLSKIMFEGPEDELKLTQNTQPALVTMSAAVWSLISNKVQADYFAGHSLGEYTAIYAAGGLSFEETVKAVHNRGKYMQSAVPVGVGAMSAVLGMDEETLVSICSEISKEGHIVEAANFNCPGQIVIAGNREAVEEASVILKEKGAKRVLPLPVSAPFHCSLMIEAKNQMEKYLNNITISDLNTPIINNVSASIEKENQKIKEGLIKQVSGTVLWTNSINKLIENGVDTFIEVGAGQVLSGLIKKINKDVTIINVSTINDLDKISSL